MKTLHLVYCPFRGVGLDQRNDEWFKERIEIFKNYTLKSLINQTNKDFTIWCSFRPEDEHNYLTQNLFLDIKEQHERVIFTYDGLMYHDDKFGGTLVNKLYNTARILRRAWRNKELPANPLNLFKDKNKTLSQRLENSLNTLKEKLGTNYETVLLTRIDSDDMFHKDALWHIRNVYENTVVKPEAITMSGGYIYNQDTKELAEYNPKTNPPFHTLCMAVDVFSFPERHLAFYGNYKSHEDVRREFYSTQIVERLYCVTTHSPKNHISTIWNHPFRGRIVSNDILKILKDFGI